MRTLAVFLLPLNIMFIFERCRCSLAVATPVKYEFDLKDMTHTFVKKKKNHKYTQMRN